MTPTSGTTHYVEAPSFAGQVLRAFRHQRSARMGLWIILTLILASLLISFIGPYSPQQQGDLVLERYLPPSAEHWFGTDKFGRDIFTRVIYGARISLAVALGVVLLAGTIGLLYGAVSGYFGGRVDSVMMRLLDFLLAFPVIFLILMAVAVFNINHWYLIPLLGLTGWMDTARLVRAEILSLKERDYILAARAMGYSSTRIILHHLIPNCLTILFVMAPLRIAEVILLESALSFLGIGVQPPTPSWGNIINDGKDVLLKAWWISTFPGIFITLTVMSFHFISEGLKKSLQPWKG